MLKKFLLSSIFILFISLSPVISTSYTVFAGTTSIPVVGGETKPGDQLPVARPGVSTKLSENYIVQVLIPYVIRLGLQIAVAASVVGIIVGGWFYITGLGEDEMYSKAKRVIKWSIFGLIISLIAYILVDIVSSLAGLSF